MGLIHPTTIAEIASYAVPALGMFARRNMRTNRRGIGSSSAGSVAPQTLREIGTRSFLPLLQAANTNKYNGRRSFFVRGGAITGIQVAWANFNVSSGAEQASTGTLSVTASIEYPIGAAPQTTPGTRAQLLFSGAATGTVASGGVLVSDLLPINIPDGSQARVWWTWQNSVKAVYANAGPYENVAGLGDAQKLVSSDFTMAGTFADDSDSNRVGWPCRIMGLSASAASDVLVIGDSLTSGFGESQATQDASGDCGEAPRAIGATHPYFRFGQNGHRAALAVSTHALQDQLTALAAPSRVIIELGTNDLNLARTAAQIYGDLQTLLARYAGIPVYLVTVPPRTTSTDVWVTTVNQTVLATEAQRVALNNLIRGNSGGFAGFFDPAAIFETSVDSGIWNVTGSSGAAAYTTDGIHATALANKLVPAFSL